MIITDKIQSWCDASLVKLVIEYDKQGRRASGNWEQELESQITVKDSGYNVKLLAAYYTWWMENGRKPSKRFPPIDKIRQWIDDKGIIPYGDISLKILAFLIARKIAREGYKGRPVVSNVLTDEWINELMMSVGIFFTEQFKSDLIKQLKAA